MLWIKRGSDIELYLRINTTHHHCVRSPQFNRIDEIWFVSIRGFENKTLEECRKMGINDSMEHVDFMIGYEGLDIDAVTKDGKKVPIFRRGKWAFDV